MISDAIGESHEAKQGVNQYATFGSPVATEDQIVDELTKSILLGTTVSPRNEASPTCDGNVYEDPEDGMILQEPDYSSMVLYDDSLASVYSAPSVASIDMDNSIYATPNSIYSEWVAPTEMDQEYVYSDEVYAASDSILARLACDKKQIQIDMKLGDGEFGEVHSGIMQVPRGAASADTDRPVAIKRVRPMPGASDESIARAVAELSDEAVLVGSFLHPNIVSLLGVCDANTSNIMVLFELCHRGSLETMLEDAEAAGRTVVMVGIPLLTGFMAAIAAAMEYLGKLRCVHRDLATRNVLITHDSVAKLADFGMSRRLAGKESTTEEATYVSLTKRPMPARWMPPEALRYKKFDPSTDVWSFGVLVWETFSLAAEPYDDLGKTSEILAFLEKGSRLSKPDGCPDTLFKHVLACWCNDPLARPGFDMLRGAFVAEHSACGGIIPGAARNTKDDVMAAEISLWAKSTLSASETIGALRSAGLGVGSFCLRASASSPGMLVLCVLKADDSIGSSRIRTGIGGECHMIDIQSPLPRFRSLIECISYFKNSDAGKLVGEALTKCIPAPTTGKVIVAETLA